VAWAACTGGAVGAGAGASLWQAVRIDIPNMIDMITALRVIRKKAGVRFFIKCSPRFHNYGK